MSLLSIATPIAAALPALNIHSHGHKKAAVDSRSESASTPISKLSAGSTEGLFGRLLNSLEETIGVRQTGANIDTKA